MTAFLIFFLFCLALSNLLLWFRILEVKDDLDLQFDINEKTQEAIKLVDEKVNIFGSKK